MKIIIYILLFLLIVSIANNYILHYYQNEEGNKDKKIENIYLVEPSKIPENMGLLNLHIFYNTDIKYEKCHQLDQIDNGNSFEKSAMAINIKKIISDIYKKNNNKCYVVKTFSNEKPDLNKYLETAIKKIS
tara:strand:+ start:204 stop:596 length:393 start_codon:yes stop_codon:yes gene_type:complete